MKKVWGILIWIGILAWLVVITGFVSGESEEVLCNRIEVILDDTLHNRFIDVTDVRSMAAASGQSLQGYPLSGINTREMEHELERNSYIRNAEVSKDITGRLEIRIEQRKALVRLLPRESPGYYIDTEGRELPLTTGFTPHILLVSGYIPSEGSAKQKVLGEIYEFASYVSGHDFWDKQIVQLYIDSRGEYEIIPRVGAHQILLGTMDDWKKKLNNLALLYEQGLPEYGWNNYRIINLKYTNQVICTKR